MNKSWQEQLPLNNIKNIAPVSGGDVNDAYIVETDNETYFLLVQKNRDADFYGAEIAGLKKFEEAGIKAPIVEGNGQIDNDAYLLLSYLQEGGRGDQRDLAKLVAKMHSQQQPDGKFGFEMPHEGGDISFDNSWCDTWRELFVERRLEPLKEALVDKGLWIEDDVNTFNQVKDVINKALKEHNSKPSLLHGDMWGGNHMFLTDGEPALFDPAPLYGDREFDMGITTVFGGFNQAFYDEYNKQFPLAKGADFRMEFYKLYILMIHLLKFGGMYATSVDRSMAKILN
ncbi:fructosamine kinase family protein [Staphylococcus kloosii]|jgi:fructosamine-3-kinase|uniref:fructosamine kinase family protein n=1 Tax=Staphylococcus kloosii TaxID=29384 RepID=UPI00189F5393|nr:fructosamine kinase family protein [Staphylococcus kloosii]MBF7024986.1 fructosamine kinase family protein [Staphylococcus kloosii]